MRRVGIFTDQKQAAAFAMRLKEKEIASEVEAADGGQYFVWVIEEDQVPAAVQELDQFAQNPVSLAKKRETPLPPPPDAPDAKEFDEVRPGRTMQSELTKLKFERSYTHLKTLWTRIIIALCVVVYLMASFQKVELAKTTSPAVLMPLMAPVEEALLYELPEAVRLNNTLIREYQYKEAKELKQLPAAGEELIKKIEANPPWGGFYEEVIARVHHEPSPPHILFQNIRTGEVWRVITPIFLHANILHILFNMWWLWILGRIVEARIGVFRYLGLILVVAAISNTLQYLMSGPFFMGFSGVIMGMAGFIWMRQILVPLEVYPIHKGAINFLWIFILGMALLQLLAFFLQLFNIVVLNLQIANTAHVSGALVGVLLARLPCFSPKKI